MMYCGQCGGMLQDGSTFCEYCGAPQIKPAASSGQIPAPKTTPVQMQTNPVGQNTQNANVATDNKSNNGPLIIIICLIVAIILALGIFIAMYFITKDDDKSAKETKSEQTTEKSVDDEKSEASAKKEEKSKEEKAKTSKSESSSKSSSSKSSSKSSSAEKAGEGTAGKQDYIISDSANKTLTDSDLAGLSSKDLSIARNEIYARHGRSFQTQGLQEYFDSKSWYSKNASYSDDMLSTVEKTNAEFISQYEDSHGGKYNWN